jgi:hypothetical protein
MTAQWKYVIIKEWSVTYVLVDTHVFFIKQKTLFNLFAIPRAHFEASNVHFNDTTIHSDKWNLLYSLYSYYFAQTC